MKNIAILSFLLTSCLYFSSAMALDIGEAKTRGLVGEKPDGYAATIKSDPEAKALVDEINAKRKANYQALAKKNKLSLSQVESLAGDKSLKKTAKGHYIYQNGRWVKK
ncbi:hypothetical protein EDC56_0486 [Sinobacterium caligoides]|uniref:DUF1318 domain-containing protein n=1 Tax=Sinobacterium caligoides TaxID=933926 RepID=A0A3N2DYS5_9GAMM|nr:YdbL family protein [Sinobacterium caligoides]ROS04968.1 hypothetical protein EDC56_0486 [Sinobacterium caligoides]